MARFGLLMALGAFVLVGSMATETSADERPITGKDDLRLKPIDEFIDKFMTEHDIPGASVAVSRHGKIVYGRGFGYADVENKLPVQPESLFRIASVSKPFTGVAIMQLVEKGKIHLDDRPFETLGIKPHLEPGTEVDPRLWKITVAQLLHHTGGFDRDVSFDPMFRSVEIASATSVNPPASPRQIIEYMMGRKLDFDPGTKEAYSNFGYCVLGRLIEHVTGMEYADYVKQQVLWPLGIDRMRTGHSWLKDRADAEVHYYAAGNPQEPSVFGDGHQVPEPYGGWFLEAMDSHGAWIAAASELVHFAGAFEYPDRCLILKAPTIKEMFARPQDTGYKDGKETDVYYTTGWSVRPQPDGKVNHWHGGLLPGTSTQLVSRHDGLCWAVLFNTDRDKEKKVVAKMVDPLMNKVLDGIPEWPDGWDFQEPHK